MSIGLRGYSVDDPQNETGGNIPYKGYASLYPGAGPLAKGEWETPQDDPSWYSGFRRYGASKLCAVMLQYVSSRSRSTTARLTRISDKSWATGCTTTQTSPTSLSSVSTQALWAPTWDDAEASTSARF